MSDAEQRAEDYKKELIDSGHEKRDGFIIRHPKPKQYCEDCKHCLIPESGNIIYARCGISKRPSYLTKTSLSDDDYYFCVSERTAGRCEKYEAKP